MQFASAVLMGYFFGFTLGVGCALGVMYSIYSGGYRRAVADSLNPQLPERYRRCVSRLQPKADAETASPHP